MCDLLIYALPRSGSTLLCSLLTSYPDYCCMPEPTSARRFLKEFVTNRMELDAGFRFPQGTEYNNIGTPMGDAFVKWGIKEIVGKMARKAYKYHSPAKILFLVRRFEEAAASYWKLLPKIVSAKDKRTTDKQKAVDWFKRTAAAQIKFAQELGSDLIRIVTYDDLLKMTTRSALESWLDWPLKGDKDYWFRGCKKPEIRKGIERRQIESDEEVLELAAEAGKEYNKYFALEETCATSSR